MAGKDLKVDIKARMKLQVIGILAMATVFFGVLYLPDEVTKVFAAKMDTVVKIVAKLGITVPFSLFASLFLFGQDHLATGNSLASQFFRHYFPSTYAVQHCGRNQAEANDLWFTYFNPWKDANHPLHSFYDTSFARSYTCRLFFYLVRILTWYLVAAAVSTVLCTWIYPTHDAQEMLVPRVVFWVGFAALTLVIKFSNRIRLVTGGSYENTYEATGAYGRYKEIEGVLLQHFWKDILGPGGCPKPS